MQGIRTPELDSGLWTLDSGFWTLDDPSTDRLLTPPSKHSLLRVVSILRARRRAVATTNRPGSTHTPTRVVTAMSTATAATVSILRSRRVLLICILWYASWLRVVGIVLLARVASTHIGHSAVSAARALSPNPMGKFGVKKFPTLQHLMDTY